MLTETAHTMKRCGIFIMSEQAKFILGGLGLTIYAHHHVGDGSVVGKPYQPRSAHSQGLGGGFKQDAEQLSKSTRDNILSTPS